MGSHPAIQVGRRRAWPGQPRSDPSPRAVGAEPRSRPDEHLEGLVVRYPGPRRRRGPYRGSRVGGGWCRSWLAPECSGRDPRSGCRVACRRSPGSPVGLAIRLVIWRPAQHLPRLDGPVVHRLPRPWDIDDHLVDDRGAPDPVVGCSGGSSRSEAGGAPSLELGGPRRPVSAFGVRRSAYASGPRLVTSRAVEHAAVADPRCACPGVSGVRSGEGALCRGVPSRTVSLRSASDEGAGSVVRSSESVVRGTPGRGGCPWTAAGRPPACLSSAIQFRIMIPVAWVPVRWRLT